MRIEPARRLRGRLRMPGDKSISHRAAIIAAMASGGRSLIQNFSTSADCASTLLCLRQLGVRIEQKGSELFVEGAGRRENEGAGRHLTRQFRAPALPLDCGNSGSTMRMLAGLLAGQPFASTLTGDDSLRARPMKRIIEPLELMGARVHSEGGHAPLRVEGRTPLKAVRYEMAVASAQVKSAILLAALNAEGRTEVFERDSATRDHTERMLRWFGVTVETKDRCRDVQNEDRREPSGKCEDELKEEEPKEAALHVVSLEGPASFAARDVVVPGDISSAAFFMAAAALLPGSELEIEGVGLNPTRTAVVTTMRALGANVEVARVREQCHEEIGDVTVRGADRRWLVPVRRTDEADAGHSANVLRGSIIAELIDELPVLAVLGTQVEGGLTIRGAAELRVKESDRIRATVENLRALGAEVEEFEDGFAVQGEARLRGARLDAHGDHRIAMAFTVAALLAEGASEIVGAECVAVSFPEFFALLESVTER